MKKLTLSALILACGLTAFQACQVEEINNGFNAGKTTVFHINALPSETKSVFGEAADGAYPTLWTTNKDVAFSRDGAATVAGTPALVNGGAGATFEVELEGENTEGIIYAFSPKGVYDSSKPSSIVPGFTSINSKYHDIFLNIPAAQTPLANSVDESAQAIVGSAAYTDGEYELDMTFSHVVAYGKMTIANFEGSGIASVAITFPEAVAGTNCYYYYTGDDEGKLSNADVKTITLDPVNVVDDVFWFAVAPTAGNTGKMKIAITDAMGATYTKTIDLTKKALPFVKGQVSVFTADFTGIGIDQAPELAEGNYAIMAKRESGNYWIMSCDLGTATTKRFQAIDSGLTAVPETIETKAANIWNVTKSGDGYILTSKDNKQITWSSGNSADLADEGKVMTVTAAEEDGAFNVSFPASATATRTLALNSSSGNDYYAFYTGSGRTNLYFVPATAAPVTLYTVSISRPTNGTVTVDKEQAEAGETITVTATPDEGYELASLMCNDTNIKATKSFTMPAEDVIITASFGVSEGGGSEEDDSKVLTFNLKSNPGGWPTTNTATLTNYTYTLDEVAYTFGLNNVKCNSGYLMVYQNGLVGLPAITGYILTKVVASNSSGCSTSVNVGISSSADTATYVSGGEAKKWGTQNSTYTYELTGTAANTVYYMFVTTKNAQITNLELTYVPVE